MKHCKLCFLLVSVFFFGAAYGQADTATKKQAASADSLRDYFEMRFKTLQSEMKKLPRDTVRNYSAFQRGVTFAGLLQTRYSYSPTKNIDVNGAYHPDSVDYVNNTFALKRVRFFIRAKINDHFDANIMTDFAELTSSSISGKVLDNAYIHYGLSPYLNVVAGQFRPYFGIEDLIPVDLIRSLDYTNGYTAFGASGWQSFQTGVTVYGKLPLFKHLPMRYYVGATNGNGKTKTSDDDNKKHIYGRLEMDLKKNVSIGINGGTGSVNSKSGYAVGADLKSTFNISSKFNLDLTSEYKDGNNFSAFSAYKQGVVPLSMSNFRMRDFYIFPDLRYVYDKPRLRTVDLAIRYEYFDPSYRMDKNPHQTITPLVGLEFADNYYSTLQLGMNIDIYKHQIDNTATINHNLMVLQMQIRF